MRALGVALIAAGAVSLIAVAVWTGGLPRATDKTYLASIDARPDQSVTETDSRSGKQMRLVGAGMHSDAATCRSRTQRDSNIEQFDNDDRAYSRPLRVKTWIGGPGCQRLR
jgi:hypothetical protein